MLQQFGSADGFGGFGGFGRRSVGGGGGAPLISSVDAAGWSAVYNGAEAALAALELGSPLVSGGVLTTENWIGASPTKRSITVTRQGFTDAGAATTISDTVFMTLRTRLAATATVNTLDAGPFTRTPTGVALSDWIYLGDTIAGATNNSTVRSPKPIGQWTDYDRKTVGNSLTVGAIFAHRDARQGRQIRCVRYRAYDDAANEVVVFVTAPTLSTYTGDIVTYPHWTATIDITSLNAGRIRVDAEAYPWFGQDNASYPLSSVLKSAQETVRWRFSTRYYQKNVTDAATPLVVCVNASGAFTGPGSINYGAGSATLASVQTARSNTPANARDFPALDINVAIQALIRDNASTASSCEIWIVGNGTPYSAQYNLSAARRLDLATVTVTRDPNISRANAAITNFSGNWRHLNTNVPAPLATTAMTFRDLTMTFVTNTIFSFTGVTAAMGVEINFDNCAITLVSTTGNTNICNTAGAGVCRFWGTSIAGLRNQQLYQPGGALALTGPHTFRGVNWTSSINVAQLNRFSNIGCIYDLTERGYYNSTVNENDGQMHWHTNFRRLSDVAAQGAIDVQLATSIGVAVINTVVERLGGDGQAFTVSNDGSPLPANNIVVHNFTSPSWNYVGGHNCHYDETANTSVASCTAGTLAPNGGGTSLFTVAGTVVGTWAIGQVVGRRAGYTEFTLVSGGPTVFVVSGGEQTASARTFSTGAVVDAGARNHGLLSWKGSILGRRACKGDIFVTQQPGLYNLTEAQASARRGNQPYDCGVGQGDNVVQWNSNFFAGYYGVNTLFPGFAGGVDLVTSRCFEQAQYTNWQAAFGSFLNNLATTGAGNGTYSLVSPHPGINRCEDRLYTSHDITGAVRIANTNNSAGAYR